MSAETLREAARLMRERAERAMPGPWESLDNGDRLVAWRLHESGFDDDFEYVVGEPVEHAGNAEHIASWHPAVALAVADWLEGAAKMCDWYQQSTIAVPESSLPEWVHYGLAVARAYLGSDQ